VLVSEAELQRMLPEVLQLSHLLVNDRNGKGFHSQSEILLFRRDDDEVILLEQDVRGFIVDCSVGTQDIGPESVAVNDDCLRIASRVYLDSLAGEQQAVDFISDLARQDALCAIVGGDECGFARRDRDGGLSLATVTALALLAHTRGSGRLECG